LGRAHAIAVDRERRVEQHLKEQAVEESEDQSGCIVARLIVTKGEQRGEVGTSSAKPLPEA
jgi:hypothetical protein